MISAKIIADSVSEKGKRISTLEVKFHRFILPEFDTAYVTTMPCMTCMKLLLNTSCHRIVYIEEYPHMEAADFWKRSGRTIHKYKGTL